MSGRITLSAASALLAIAVPGHGAIIINEFMADPAAVSDTAGEWVELYNSGGVAVDLGSWQLVDDPAGTTHTLTFAAGTIVPAGGFAVIVRNADPAVNGGVTGGIAFSSMSLGNSSNELLLRDDGGLEVDRVSWDSGWSGTAGTSWELLNPGSDNADPVNWASATTQWAPPSSDLGTPGAANSALATVPEPSALALTLPLLVATGAWRRRRQR